MASIITINCGQCDQEQTWTLDEFIVYVREAPNTRVNLEDMGALNLSWYCCDYCNETDDDDDDDQEAQP